MYLSWVFFALLLLALGYAVWLFNALVRARNLSESAWADIDVQLQRRHDLVPRLVQVVKGYAEHEKATLESVVQKRDLALRASSVGEKSEIETELDDAIGRLVVLAEAYPDLKAGENFAQLSSDLVDIENHLQFARRFYNGAVRDYNTRVEQFPDRLLAQTFGFEQAEFFQAQAGARAPVATGSLS